MTVVTRFAPSPTGFLHIGGARTALFSWLFARHHDGRFLLRIEDTDRARSTDEAIEAIYDGLRWLGLDWDGDAISQFSRVERHAAAVEELLTAGHAYRCYCTPEELAEMRTRAREEGRTRLYDGRWRDRDPAEAPPGIDPVIRLKMPLDGETTIADRVQGEVTVRNDQLDDMVLLRSDGTPTYMLAVVVDDHDMGVTHVIRGDDHFTNAFRQTQLFCALGWEPPVFAHIPLIHGPDGAKLSKRHGALAVQAYREMGYLPAAMRNYLLRLGWSHGDDEIISTAQAIDWFGLDAVGKSPARFDFAKLESVNAHYLKTAEDPALVDMVAPLLAERLGYDPASDARARLLAAMPAVKERAKTLVDLADGAWFCVAPRPLEPDEKAEKLLTPESRSLLGRLAENLAGIPEWSVTALETVVRDTAETEGVKLGKIAQPLRAALTGRTASPGIFDVLAALGRDESLGRLADAAGTGNSR